MARRHVFADEGEDFWVDVRPRCGAIFGYGDVVKAEEDGGYAVDVEEGCGERRRVRWGEGGARRKVFKGGDAFGKNALVGFEFKGLGLLVVGIWFPQRGSIRLDLVLTPGRSV